MRACPDLEILELAALDGPDVENGELASHLAACEACREQFNGLLEEEGMLRGAFAQPVPALSEFSEHRIRQQLQRRLRPGGRWPMAVAAALCFALLGLVLSQLNTSQQITPEETPVLAYVEPEPAELVTAEIVEHLLFPDIPGTPDSLDDTLVDGMTYLMEEEMKW